MVACPSADPTSDLVTLIITTSPTLSAPSTSLLSTVLQSFRAHCAPLLDCKVIIVFDAWEQITAQPRLKKGHVTPESAANYAAYKDNVERLFLEEYQSSARDGANLIQGQGEAEYGAPSGPRKTKPVSFATTYAADGRVTFIHAIGQRLGFGLAVRTALRVVETPFVWVHQHDWALVYDIPIKSLVGVMRASEAASDLPPIKYVCLASARRSSYATSAQVMPFQELRRLTAAHAGDYAPLSGLGDVVPLTPMFFWHDKPHIASTAHYLQRVFPSRLAMMRGAFIEDTIGQKARGQMKQGQWAKWATWLYNPDEGKQVCLRHLHGRTWRGDEEEARMKEAHRQRNLAEMRQRLERVRNRTAEGHSNTGT